MGWGFLGLPGLIMFPIIAIALVVVGYLIFRGCGWGWGGGCCGSRGSQYGRYRSDEEKETFMEILRRRYANGEISKEQYEQMKNDLKN